MLSPSGDWIGQPSTDGVLSSALSPWIVSIFCADDHAYAEPATARTRRKRETPVSARVLLRIATSFRSSARGASGVGDAESSQPARPGSQPACSRLECASNRASEVVCYG